MCQKYLLEGLTETQGESNITPTWYDTDDKKNIDQLDLKKKKEFNSRNPKKLLLLRKKCYLFLLQVSRGVTSWSTD